MFRYYFEVFVLSCLLRIFTFKYSCVVCLVVRLWLLIFFQVISSFVVWLADAYKVFEEMLMWVYCSFCLCILSCERFMILLTPPFSSFHSMRFICFLRTEFFHASMLLISCDLFAFSLFLMKSISTTPIFCYWVNARY